MGPAPAFDLAAFKAMLDDTMAPIKAELDSLKAKVAEQDLQIPKFVPMQNRTNPSGMPRNPKEIIAAMKRGDELTGTMKSIPITQNGKRLDQGNLAAFIQSYQPQFQAGQDVRINPDAHREGWAEGRTWGALLAKDRVNPDGWATIVEIAPFSHRGWMYRVKATGHTPERGMIFDEHELVSA